MKPLRTVLLVLVLPAVLWSLPACDDDPFAITWVENPDTVVLYSLDRPELNLPAAFDFINRRRVAVESPGATGNWDMVLSTEGGALVFLPPRALEIDSEAGIAVFPGLNLDELREAPGDSASYAITEPVSVEPGSAYVIRTRESRGRFRQICAFYGKFEPIEVDLEARTVRIVYDLNPDCDDRSLVPDQESS